MLVARKRRVTRAEISGASVATGVKRFDSLGFFEHASRVEQPPGSEHGEVGRELGVGSDEALEVLFGQEQHRRLIASLDRGCRGAVVHR